MTQPTDKYIRSTINAGAVLNTDTESLKAYKLQKKRLQEIDQLKNEMHEIKSMLTQLLQNSTK